MPLSDETAREDPVLLRRMLDFEFALERDAAELVVPVDSGTAVLNPSEPLLWDNNYLVLEQAGSSTRDLAELAEEVLGAHGASGLAVGVLDPAEAARLEPGFVELGWKVDRGVFMAYRGAPDRPPEAEVREVSGEEIVELRREVILDSWASDYDGDPEEVTTEFLAQQARLDKAGADRWFVAGLDGVPSSCCRLLARDGLGQVEDVATAARARNRGLARATILAVVEASRAQGDELTFIGAEADDWPWKFYERLGFEAVGTELAFLSESRETPRLNRRRPRA